jgi:DNA-binding CsgD family transcriptional regulator
VGSFFSIRGTLDFVYRISKGQRLALPLRFALYAPPVFFFAASVVGYNVPFGGFHYAPGRWWVFEPQTNLAWGVSYAGYGIAVMVLAVTLLLQWHRTTVSRRERLQARVIVTGIVVSAVLQWGEFLVVSRLMGWEIPSLTPVLAIPWIVGMYVAVQRYNLLDMRPERIVEEAFESVSQGIVLLDTSGTVTYHNREAARIVGAECCIDGHLIATMPRVAEWISAGGEIPEFRRVCRLPPGETLVYGRSVADRFGDAIGFMVFLYPGPDDATLFRAFGLSERESEVYRELLTGKTLRDIATTLGITERTVKAHVHRIYEKTGVENRAELAAGAWTIRS